MDLPTKERITVKRGATGNAIIPFRSIIWIRFTKKRKKRSKDKGITTKTELS